MDPPNMVNLSSSRWAPASLRTQSRSPHPTSNVSTTYEPTYPSTFQKQSSHASDPNWQTPSDPSHRHNPQPVSSSQRAIQSRHSSLQRFTRLFRRLRHKSLLLLYSHHRVLHLQSTTTIHDTVFPLAPGESETMFRVDFFEWYVLLERCLVELLDSVGVGVRLSYDPLRSSGGVEKGRSIAGSVGRVGVSTGPSATDAPITSADAAGDKDMGQQMEGRGSLVGDSFAFSGMGGYAHRFHESVLDALDVPTRNPVHAILGQGRVREYIGVAKEFRNRWKDFDVHHAPVPGEANGVGEAERVDLEVVIDRKLRRYEKILKDLNLDEMLGAILAALGRAESVAEEELKRVAVEMGVDQKDKSKTNGDWEMDVEVETGVEEGDTPFEAGVDAMEWD